MQFVAIDTDIAGDRVTIELARAFKLKRAAAVGLLTLTFAGMAKHAQDGHLEHVLDEQIEEWAYWHGRPGAYAAFVRVNLCDDNGLVSAWERWNGKMISRANAEAERLRQYRDDKRRERDANKSRTSTVPVRDGVASVLPNLTKPNQTKPTTETTGRNSPNRGESATEKVTWLTPIGAAWDAENGKGSFPYGQAAKELKPLRDAGNTPETIAAHLAWYLRVRGLDTLDPDPVVIERTRFTPSLRDFRLRFAKFNPARAA